MVSLQKSQSLTFLPKDKVVLEGLRHMIPENCPYGIEIHHDSPACRNWIWSCEKPVYIYETGDIYDLIDIATCLSKTWSLGDLVIQWLRYQKIWKSHDAFNHKVSRWIFLLNIFNRTS